jgi:glutaredoxin
MSGWMERILQGGRTAKRVHAVVVYTRRNCGCCDRALAVLEAAAERYPLQVQLIDLDTQAPAELRELYTSDVPVVVIDGKARFKGQVNPALLERILQKPPADASPNPEGA